MKRDLLDSLDWRLDPRSREWIGRGRRVRLAEKPFLVLEALVEAQGAVVSRETLRKRLWSENTFVDFENNLNSAVATLRQVMGDSARAPRYIETIPKVGYRLLVPDENAARKPRSRLGSSRALAVMSVALVAIATLALVGDDNPKLRKTTSAVEEAQRLFERGLYLRGRFDVTRHETSLLTSARESFAEARKLDPRFASAPAEEAESWVQESFEGLVGFRQGLERAREAARRALELDPSQVTGLRVRAMAALFLDWDFESARTSLDRAARLDPLDARTALAQATLFASEGRHEDAIVAAEWAVALDPEAYYVRADLAMFYLAAGRNEEASACTRLVLDVAPDFLPALTYRVVANERLGKWDEAAEAARTLMRRQDATDGELSRADEASSRDAVSIWRDWDLERMETMAAGREDDFALLLALRYAAVGERARALEKLERAYARRDALLVFVAAFPELHGLRGDPRFEQLFEKIRRG